MYVSAVSNNWHRDDTTTKSSSPSTVLPPKPKPVARRPKAPAGSAVNNISSKPAVALRHTVIVSELKGDSLEPTRVPSEKAPVPTFRKKTPAAMPIAKCGGETDRQTSELSEAFSKIHRRADSSGNTVVPSSADKCEPADKLSQEVTEEKTASTQRIEKLETAMKSDMDKLGEKMPPNTRLAVRLSVKADVRVDKQQTRVGKREEPLSVGTTGTAVTRGVTLRTTTRPTPPAKTGLVTALKSSPSRVVRPTLSEPGHVITDPGHVTTDPAADRRTVSSHEPLQSCVEDADKETNKFRALQIPKVKLKLVSPTQDASAAVSSTAAQSDGVLDEKMTSVVDKHNKQEDELLTERRTEIKITIKNSECDVTTRDVRSETGSGETRDIGRVSSETGPGHALDGGKMDSETGSRQTRNIGKVGSETGPGQTRDIGKLSTETGSGQIRSIGKLGSETGSGQARDIGKVSSETGSGQTRNIGKVGSETGPGQTRDTGKVGSETVSEVGKKSINSGLKTTAELKSSENVKHPSMSLSSGKQEQTIVTLKCTGTASDVVVSSTKQTDGLVSKTSCLPKSASNTSTTMTAHVTSSSVVRSGTAAEKASEHCHTSAAADDSLSAGSFVPVSKRAKVFGSSVAQAGSNVTADGGRTESVVRTASVPGGRQYLGKATGLSAKMSTALSSDADMQTDSSGASSAASSDVTKTDASRVVSSGAHSVAGIKTAVCKTRSCDTRRVFAPSASLSVQSTQPDTCEAKNGVVIQAAAAVAKSDVKTSVPAWVKPSGTSSPKTQSKDGLVDTTLNTAETKDAAGSCSMTSQKVSSVPSWVKPSGTSSLESMSVNSAEETASTVRCGPVTGTCVSTPAASSTLSTTMTASLVAMETTSSVPKVMSSSVGPAVTSPVVDSVSVKSSEDVVRPKRQCDGEAITESVTSTEPPWLAVARQKTRVWTDGKI